MLRKTIFFSIFTVFALTSLFLFDQTKYNDNKLHIIFCDVGQGDAIFIRTPKGSDILIDGGPNDSVLSCLSNNMPFWDRTIEAVFLTHPHSDHLNGLIYVLKRYEVKYYFTEARQKESNLEKREKAILAEKKIKPKDVFAGNFIETKDKVKILTLWPEETSIASMPSGDLDKNGLSLIQLLVYGQFKLLLTGDAEEPVEDKIAPLAGDIDVLKVPHHGSYNAISPGFLTTTSPDLAVISVGKNNKYGLPNKQILDLLKNANVKILRTDQVGEIEIISDGKSYKVKN